jgi:hypothetical protein
MVPIADSPNSSTSASKVVTLALLPFVVLPGSSDPAIVRALELLGDAAPTTPIVVVHTASPVATLSVATAWTDGNTVFVNDQSDAYKHAGKNAIALAAALAHEGFHVVNGPAEAPAYAVQLRVMRKLGAKKGDIEAVERGLRAAERAISRR